MASVKLIIEDTPETTVSNLVKHDVSYLTSTKAANSFTNSNLTVPEGCIVINFNVSWESPDDPISRNVEIIFGLAVTGVILPLFFLISAPTNIINMAVFYKQGLKERINLCLFWRSCLDFLDMSQNYLLNSDTFHAFLTTSERQGVILYFYIRSRILFLAILTWVSAFTTTIIALERCVCVVSPLYSRRFLKTRTMVVIFFLLFIVILGLNYLCVLQWSLTCMYDPRSNSTVTIMYPSEEYLKLKYLVDTLQGTVFGTIFPIFCISVVTLSTVITSVYLRKFRAWRENSTSAASPMNARDEALTRTLVTLSVLFIACYAIAFISLNAGRIFPEVCLGGRYHNTFRFLTTCGQLTTYINASFHFFFYYSTGSKYRKVCRELFRCSSVTTVTSKNSATANVSMISSGPPSLKREKMPNDLRSSSYSGQD